LSIFNVVIILTILSGFNIFKFMKMRPFRPDEEPVKDKELAEDMARASDRFRTREAEKEN